MKQDIAIIWDLNGVLFKNLTLDRRTFEIVQELNSIGVPQYVCTNTRVWKLDKWIKEFSLDKHFKKIFSSKRMGLLKSNPLVYEYLLDEIKESELYFIDDSVVNLKVAETFNINCIHYKSDLQLKTDLKWLKIMNDR